VVPLLPGFVENTGVTEMAKHSPGPWFRHGQKDDPCGSAIIRASNGFEVANSRSFLIEEYEANANLIAAAPDLLAALKWVATSAAKDSMEMWQAVNAAIAKAEGR
jgi:hypothetical protein